MREKNVFSLKLTTLCLVISGILTILPTSVSASSDNQLLERIEQLEQQLQSLKRQLQANALIKSENAKLTDSKRLPVKASDFRVKVGGYVKADAGYSQYSGGELSPNNPGRQFYIPALIPVGGEGERTDLDMQSAESRIHLSATQQLNGHSLALYSEMDFFLSGQGNESVSNSFSPRLRRFFFRFDNWLLGQDWTTFQDTAAMSENLDIAGPTEGTTFVRQTQLRYTHGNFQFAVENPETTLTPYGGGKTFISDDGNLPDFIARHYFKGHWGQLVLAGIYRQLRYDTASDSSSEHGYGLSFSGKLNMANGDDLRFMLTSGSGLGRYMGVNTANGVVIDASGNLEAIDSTGGFVAYRHLWNPQWRSNITYSHLKIDNNAELTGNDVTSSVWSFRVNLLYSPTPKTTFGVEYMTAERELESGLSGDMDRLLFSGKYAF